MNPSSYPGASPLTLLIAASSMAQWCAEASVHRLGLDGNRARTLWRSRGGGQKGRL